MIGISPLSIGLAVLGGAVTVFSPCILPILPILIGRSLQTHRYGPVALVMGIISGFAVAGSLLGITSTWLIELSNFMRILAIALLLVLGIFSMFPRLSYAVTSRLRLPKLPEPERINLTGEFILGSQLGLLWTPCAGTVLGSILVLAAAEQQIFSAFVLLLFYGIGAGVPMLMLAYAGRHFSKSFVKLRVHGQLLQRVAGTMIAVTAIAIIMGWDVQIQLWLAPYFPTFLDL